MFLFLSALACLVALAFALVPLFRSAPEARAVQREEHEARADLPAVMGQTEDLPSSNPTGVQLKAQEG